jgi:hypothetical protein
VRRQTATGKRQWAKGKRQWANGNGQTAKDSTNRHPELVSGSPWRKPIQNETNVKSKNIALDILK